VARMVRRVSSSSRPDHRRRVRPRVRRRFEARGQIKVFEPDGGFLRTIGREGAGPGEFYAPVLIAVRGNVLAVHDIRNSRTSVFDTSGAYLRSWPSSCCFTAPIHIDQAHRIYVATFLAGGAGKAAILAGTRGPPGPSVSRGTPYVRYDSLGKMLDTLFVPDRNEGRRWVIQNARSVSATIVPFTRRIVRGFHPAGGFVYGWNGDYTVVVSPSGNDTARIVSRTWTPERIPDAMRTTALNAALGQFGRDFDPAAVRAVVKAEDIPTTAPAFTALRVDGEGNIWARRLVGSDSTQTTFDVFAPDGRWVGSLAAPIALGDHGNDVWLEGALFAPTEGTNGRPVVKKFRIAK